MKQKKKFKSSVRRFVPNFLTILALCFGFSAAKFAMELSWDKCIYMTFLAAFFDGIDGKVARFMKCSSDFGAELDSLFDFVNFGAAPAIVLYHFSLSSIHILGWSLILIYLICIGMRLARFNTSVSMYENFLVGMPAPFGPIIAYIPMMLFCGFGIKMNVFWECIFVFVSAMLMVSKLPTVSIKTVRISRKMFIPFAMFCVFFVSMTLYNYWLTLSAFSILYLFSIPCTFFMERFKKA